MRSDKETKDKCQSKGGGEANKHGLRKLSNSDRVYGVENGGSDDSSQGMQESGRTKQLTGLLMRYMLGQGRLKCRRAYSSNACYAAGENHQRTSTSKGVPEVSQSVEEDCNADDDKIEVITARATLLGLAGLAMNIASNKWQDDDETQDSASVHNGQEDSRLERLPVELVAGINDDDGHTSHGDTEQDCVDGSQEHKVAPECR